MNVIAEKELNGIQYKAVRLPNSDVVYRLEDNRYKALKIYAEYQEEEFPNLDAFAQYFDVLFSRFTFMEVIADYGKN